MADKSLRDLLDEPGKRSARRGSSDDGLRRLLAEWIPEAHWQPIETPSTGAGTPDVNWCLWSREGWIECKRTSGWTVTLRPEQVAWLERRARAGGRVHVAVRRRHSGGPKLGPPADELWLLDGARAREAKMFGLPRDYANEDHRYVRLRLRGGPSRWDWTAVRNVLVA